MPRCSNPFLYRASRAFSSLAASCVLTLLALLVLALGVLQETHADGVSGGGVNAASPLTTLPDLESAAKPVVSQATQSRTASTPPWTFRWGMSSRSKESPVREMFGLSKIAFPLLVSDVAPVSSVGNAAVMSGSTVGVQ